VKRLGFVLLMATLTGAVIFASPASAHAELLSTVPATAGQVGSAPAAVVLNFNEPPQGRYSTIHITGPDGQRRDSGPARVVKNAVTESLGGSRPPGRYVVDWRVISDDGHPVAGQLVFTASAAAGALPARQTVAAAAKSSSNSAAVVVIIVAVGVIALIGLLLALRRLALRRRRATQSTERPTP
jgi:methionine-rich copper-binding protein CopC